MPVARFFQGAPLDLSCSVHGRRVSTPFGPAAGPHTQLAQNIVLSWLAGGRVIELKTVQIKDDLVIPRPCIDMQTVGFNVEWSQELTLEQSLEEYVKASMLIDMLKTSGWAPAYGDTVFDMSVGYDLAGIRSARVQAFMAGLIDATAVIERLRARIPQTLALLRDTPFTTRISDTVTLSTFHGCPPQEIEAIAAFLLQDLGLHVVVKLNPTLLGRTQVNEILHDRLGYRDLHVPDAAFEKDATWEQVTGFVERLGEPGAFPRPRLRREILQYPAGRQSQELFPGEREADVSLRPAIARSGDAAGAALPPEIRRPLPNLVLRRHRCR